MKDEIVELGDRVKDRISGFTGIAICRNEWINKCVRFGVQPEETTKEHKPAEAQYLDVEQLVVVKKGVIKVDKSIPESRRPNGPRDTPRRAQDPR